ncbi:MAG: FtsX-like permease family protein [Polyangiaceae bacterium]
MNVFARKLWRDLRAQKGSTAAVLVVAALGVLMLVASAGAYSDLRDSYTSTRVKLALAGLHVDAVSVTEADRVAVSALPDVAIAETRTVAEVPVAPSKKVPGLRATLRILSLPDSGEPALDRTLVVEGKLPSGDGEVLVEKHFATRHGLASGSSLDVGPGVSVRVSGVAVSAEYLWVARDQNDFMTSPDEMGVAWMRRGALRGLAAGLMARGDGALVTPSLRIAGSEGLEDQLLVQPKAGVAPATVAAAVRGVLGERALRETAADDLVGVKLLQMDVDGYKGMAAFFPLFFLTVAAFILASALARTVDAQRSIVGTWLALGVARSRILVHYLSYALVLGVGGAVLGGLLGLAVAPEMTREYANELNIPFVEAHLHLDLLGLGVLVGALTALLAAAVPVFRVLQLTPAEAMRPPRPSIGARWPGSRGGCRRRWW